MVRTTGTRMLNGDILAHGRRILRAEATALQTVADCLDVGFLEVIERLDGCAGRVVVTGVGKSEDVGRKIAGTLNSTGTRAYFLNATNALHGDLGMVHPDDVALVLSHSGESEEIVRLLPALRGACAGVTAFTGNDTGTLARIADAAIVYGSLTEACPLNLAPSTSTTVMLALGDAVAFTLSHRRGLTAEQFARNHPAGSLGRKLARVETYMRQGSAVRVATADETVRDVFAKAGRRGRRTGAILILDDDGRLCGIFTDSDLARLFEQRADAFLDRPIRDIMTRNPRTVPAGTMMGDALDILKEHKISELPVVDAAGHPAGVLDITDLLDLMPVAEIQTVDPDGPPLRFRRSA